jgi:hypothetical protein
VLNQNAIFTIVDCPMVPANNVVEIFNREDIGVCHRSIPQHGQQRFSPEVDRVFAFPMITKIVP